jgi:DNA polymerase-3 subunit epsilon
MQLNFLDHPIPTKLSAGFPDAMVLLDCETTGEKVIYHRIIEIGLIVIEGGVVVETWQSFIDPKVSLTTFIQTLTGITPEMVDGAPAFSDIAEELLSKLKGRTLVAHNARFDYGFLKNEFERAGYSYNAKPLCSVKFSRNLYPQFKRHGLSQIITRFDLAIENRHRALDDAKMIYQFFQKTSALFSDDEIAATCALLQKRPSLPTLLGAKETEKLPNSAGVYYFYDERGTLLYAGKSVNIRNRVMIHFSPDYKNPRDLRMSTKIAYVDFEQTPSGFGAQNSREQLN